MNEANNRVTIRVWGDYACFTRPEMKVERVSYPLCTPSAARGILEAVFWEPQMYYVIDNITVVKKGRWFAFRRNEVTAVINISQARSWMSGNTPVKYVSAGGGAPDAAQRNMLGLADVEYLVTAEVHTSRLYNPGRGDRAKYIREIRDRAAKGKCYHRPALGCREFAADFDLVEDVDTTLESRSMATRGDRDWRKIWPEEDLGLMLYDVFDVDRREQGFRWLSEEELELARSRQEAEIAPSPKAKQRVSGAGSLLIHEGAVIQPHATFFPAKIKDARMDCHPDRVTIIRGGRKEVI